MHMDKRTPRVQIETMVTLSQLQLEEKLDGLRTLPFLWKILHSKFLVAPLCRAALIIKLYLNSTIKPLKPISPRSYPTRLLIIFHRYGINKITIEQDSKQISELRQLNETEYRTVKQTTQ